MTTDSPQPRTTPDAFGRPLRDLRISLTDRCNFRCTYCMPRDRFGAAHAFLPRGEILSFEEIERLVRLFAELGVRKLRLTGGEPLLRRDIEKLIARLAVVPGIEDISLTTNGSLLDHDRAQALAGAGLRRVTVSLDALDDTVFHRVNDVGFPVARVLAAIEHAVRAGLAPVKINAVIRRGVNEDQILPLAERFRGSGCIPRFIEYMDVGASNGWRLDDVVPAREIVARIDERWPLAPLPPNYPGETANRWRYADGGGEIGVIASVTQPFCGGCTRARLSAEGKLFTCLFGTHGHDLRRRLREGASDEYLRNTLGLLWTRRRDRYSERRGAATAAQRQKVEMSYIGG
jgi:cyclic pyranopterin phosphate synthase